MTIRVDQTLFVLLLQVSFTACTSGFSKEELMRPEACQSCHPEHYRQWAGSMHAYAALDPVFIAMNQRGQRETNGELGAVGVRS